MKTLREIVSAYKHETEIFTDEAAAASLGCSKHAFSNYMRGDRRMPDTAIVKLAEVTRIDTSEVLTAVNLNLKQIPEQEKSFWLEKATAFTIVMGLLGGSLMTPSDSYAAEQSLVSEGRGCWFDPSRARHLHELDTAKSGSGFFVVWARVSC